MEIKKRVTWYAVARMLKEYRAPVVDNLLCRARWEWQIEILNKKTRQLNYVWPSRKHQDIWPKWIDFQSLAVDLRCPTCEALLCKAVWTTLEVEISCSHCKTINHFHIKDLYEPLFKTLSLMAKNNFLNKIKQIIS